MAQPTLRLFDGFAHTAPQLRSAVLELQNLLMRRGYRVRLDGEYGPYLENVVKLFQTSRGLSANGIVGPETWNMLTKQVVAPVVYKIPTTLAVDDKHMREEQTEMLKYKNLIMYSAQKINVPVSLLAGIGSQESRWGLALTPKGPEGTGDGGHGRSLFQVDDRWHPEHINSGDWKIPAKHIPYACSVLRWSIDYFSKNTGLTGLIALQGGVAGYNRGPKGIVDNWNSGRDLDAGTALNKYSASVFNRMGWFQLQGWQ